MHKLVIGLLLVATACISGCTASHLEIFPDLSDPGLSDKKIEPAQLREDVDAFVAGIVQRHPDVERYASLDKIYKKARSLKAELTEPMTRQTFYKKIGALSHLFNDGHTFLLWPYQEYQALKEKELLTFPFSLEVFPEGVFLKYDYQFNGVTLPKGSQLVSVNTIDTDKIFSQAQQFVGGETKQLRKHIVAARFPVMIWAVFGFVDTFELELLIDGENRQITVGAEDNWQQSNPLTADDNGDFVYQRLNDDTGYLKVATFDVSPDWFEEFIDDTFLTIHQQKVHNLIIDIRDNNGGNTDTATYLARYLASAPFQMISSMRERLNVDNRGVFNYRGNVGEVLAEKWDEWIEPVKAQRRFNGNAYVLISPVSYSSAIVFATAVKDNDIATLVGRKTGGYANQTAQGNLFNLPHSELRVYVATRLLVRPGGDLTTDGVKPDIRVSATDEQITSGRDADILAALEHAAFERK
ncbi:S41 family peptidase [Alteromonas halophila]|uniref:Tail specific protease domain-containing protein n=1 Tax=Alteromonas halophila TaxID=516698 RepID=A0A918JDY8_9ALTE|nr:S41 family peptidase [Alteromonas halophila]GGW76197.1 hypothetical protein GCM10007391_05900 [Alteromonas halophila]